MRWPLLAAACVLSACATGVHERLDADRQRVEAARERAERDHRPQPAVDIRTGAYIGGATTRPLARTERLPAVFDQDVDRAESMSLRELVADIGALTAMPVDVTTAVHRDVAERDAGVIRLRYEGSLAGYLDAATAQINAHWRVDGDTLKIFRRRTRVFDMAAMLGDVEVISEVTNESSAGGDDAGGGGAGGRETETAIAESRQVLRKAIESDEADVWASIRADVAGIAGEAAAVQINPVAGTLTVTATPRALKAVAAYVRQVNQSLTRQIALKATLYRLSLDRARAIDFDIDGVFTDTDAGEADHRIRLDGADAVTAPDAAGALTGTILDPGSELTDTQVVLEALDEHGEATVVQTGEAVTLNNQPTRVQRVRRQGFLASVEQTTTVNVGQTASLEPGQVTTGYSLTATPRVLGNNRILVQAHITLSELNGLVERVSGDNSIQTPDTSDQEFTPRAALKSGQTLVLAGFSQREAAADKDVGLFSVAAENARRRTVLILTLTASIVDGARS